MARRVSGTVNVDRIEVPFGEVFLLDGNFTLKAKGNITVFGDIVADARTPPGSKIRLHSTGGEILVAGKVTAANGAAGNTPPTAPVVTAGPGRGGGAVEIVSDRGRIVILQTAKVASGTGGDGGNAVAAATGAAASLVKAISGAGGSGGRLTQSAGEMVVVEGEVRAGAGGWGGLAMATGEPTEAPILPLPDPGAPPSGPPEVAPGGHAEEEPPRGTGFPAVVEATAGKGGRGGDLVIDTTGRGGSTVSLWGKVLAGDGGGSLTAIAANAGKRAIALVEAGGPGGDVTITMIDSAMAIQTPGKGELQAGNGGDCGDTFAIKFPAFDPNEPPVFFVDNAVASAFEAALAWIGHPAERDKPAGGVPGTVTATAVWRGPPDIREPIALGVVPATGGDSTGALATVFGQKPAHEYGDNHVGARPGRVQKAELP